MKRYILALAALAFFGYAIGSTSVNTLRGALSARAAIDSTIE